MTTCGATLRRISGPDAEPVTIAEMKQHLRIEADFTDDDSHLQKLIKAGREYCEDYTDRAFVEQVLQMKWDGFPPCLCLRRPYVIHVESVGYIDNNGDEQSVAESGYVVNVDDLQPSVLPSYGNGWPAARIQQGSVVVTYKAGYRSAGSPTDAEEVPEGIKLAIMLHAEAHYDRDPREYDLLLGACHRNLDFLRVYS